MFGRNKYIGKRELTVIIHSLILLLLVVTLFKIPLLLTLILLILNVSVLFLLKSKVTTLNYLGAFMFGSISEIFAIYFGVWNYSIPSFFGIPIWLPFVWGSAGLLFCETALFLINILEKKEI